MALACGVDPAWLALGRRARRSPSKEDFGEVLHEALVTVERLAIHPDATGRAGKLLRTAAAALSEARTATKRPVGRPRKG
jgi:hypothetical protein